MEKEQFETNFRLDADTVKNIRHYFKYESLHDFIAEFAIMVGGKIVYETLKNQIYAVGYLSVPMSNQLKAFFVIKMERKFKEGLNFEDYYKKYVLSNG